MKTLKEFLEEQAENTHKNGTYVSANLDQSSTKKLYKWCQDNGINNPIDPFKKDNEYHVTVVYSRKGISQAEGEDIGLPMNLKIVGWDIFTSKNGQKCLVGKVDSKELTKAHDMYMSKYGATHDFDSYKPHLTVSYDYGDGKAPKDLPDFELTFNTRSFKALDPTYIPSNNKD